ncbi:TolC family outer membrane protein [Desulfogranum mediterraneum]|uniref:TolC family outer membrane protein n=1 Tax=Desulfogranum mediterraneum TaxID=160661 RepID=UPI0003FC66AA|nr:TolC family outer membrane protein [Desulfogranum mediterraneum]
MVQRLTTLTAILTLLLVSSSSAETLQDAVQEMISTNPNVRTVAYNRLARDEEVVQARADYFPKVDLQLGAGKDYVNQPFDEDLSPQLAQLSLRQNVFAGLSTKNEIERQKARVRSEAYIVRTTAENTALKTSRVYLEVLKNQRVLELAEENLLIHQRISDQIKLRSSSGVGSKADMDQIRSRLTLAQSNLIVGQQNLLDAKTNYLAVVGHLPAGLTQPEINRQLLPETMEQAEQLAIAKHPTLQSANADLDARHFQDQVAKSPFYPVVDLELDQLYESETNYSFEEREDLRAMVRLRYNLFNGWRDKARKAETKHLINEAREIRNNTHRQVVESIRLSWQSYQAALNRIVYLKQRVEFATSTASAYSQQWNIGKRTLLDVLDSEAERIDSLQQLIVARYDGLYAQYRILNGTGRIVHALDLQWPEEALLDDEETPEPQEES